MKTLLISILLIISTSIYAVDKFNPITGRVQVSAVKVGQVTYGAAMEHQGDLVFKTTLAITIPATSSNPDIFDLETEILYMPNVSVGEENYEVYMSHLGDFVFKVSSVTKLEKGQFIDSAVAGLSYRTETRSDITNANGEFFYLAGETIVFGIGDLDFPTATAAQIMTPLELAHTEDINNTGVVNMARLLQSLDTDCDPDNGIRISRQAILAAAGMSLNFQLNNFASQIADLVANGGQEDDACKVLISRSKAISHLQESLDNLDN